MTWVKKFFQRKREEPDQQLYLLCSACMSRVAEEDVRVIPWWNTTLEDFLTTYRCERCWIECLEQTRIKIKSRDAEVREKFCEFLQRHGYAAEAQTIRQASLNDAVGIIGKVLDEVESRRLIFSP